VAGRLPTSKTIREQTRDIKACREADVPVERYGHLGGTGTGGPVRMPAAHFPRTFQSRSTLTSSLTASPSDRQQLRRR